MLKLVIEGPDASGKSTLVRKLCERHNFRSLPGAGPEKWPGEINERSLEMFRLHTSTEFQIFERHPCISHPIYCQITGKPPMNDAIRRHLYTLPSLIIYCLGRGFENHEPGDEEDPAHLSKVQGHYTKLCRLYDQWAVEHAHLIYDYSDPFRFNIISDLVEKTHDHFF